MPPLGHAGSSPESQCCARPHGDKQLQLPGNFFGSNELVRRCLYRQKATVPDGFPARVPPARVDIQFIVLRLAKVWVELSQLQMPRCFQDTSRSCVSDSLTLYWWKKKKRSVCDSRPICCTKNLGFLLSVLDFHQSKHSPLHVLWRNTSSMNRIYHGMPTRASSILYVPALLPQVSDFLKPGKDLGLSCKQQQPKTSWRMLGVRSARQIPP